MSGSALRQQETYINLREQESRTSLLSQTAARAFRKGRKRLYAARALRLLRESARSRRLASTVTARILALRLSRCLQSWSAETQRLSNCATASSSAAAFATSFAAYRTQTGAREFLRRWAVGAGQRFRRRRETIAVSESFRVSRLRTAVRSWKEVCWSKEVAAITTLRNLERMRRLRALGGIRRWHRETFGDIREVSKGYGRRGGRVLTRLVGVAVKVDDAGNRRRARKALRRWLGHVKGVRKRAEVERWKRFLFT